MKTNAPGKIICMAGGSRKKIEKPPFDDSNPPLYLQLRSGPWIAVSFADIYTMKAPENSWARVELWIKPGSYFRGMEACFKDDQPTTEEDGSLEAVSSGGG